MSVTLNQAVVLDLVDCYSCGMTFGVPREWNRNRINDKESWSCPNGHSQSYLGKPLEEQLADAKQARSVAEAQAREARAKLDAERDRLARLKKRVKAGVCPCCQRTFTCLARHMKSKHPEYAK